MSKLYLYFSLFYLFIEAAPYFHAQARLRQTAKQLKACWHLALSVQEILLAVARMAELVPIDEEAILLDLMAGPGHSAWTLFVLIVQQMQEEEGKKRCQ